MQDGTAFLVKIKECKHVFKCSTGLGPKVINGC